MQWVPLDFYVGYKTILNFTSYQKVYSVVIKNITTRVLVEDSWQRSENKLPHYKSGIDQKRVGYHGLLCSTDDN